MFPEFYSEVESVPKIDYILNRMNRPTGKNILVIEDDKDIAEPLRDNPGLAKSHLKSRVWKLSLSAIWLKKPINYSF